jgi:hypothetical protein
VSVAIALAALVLTTSGCDELLAKVLWRASERGHETGDDAAEDPPRTRNNRGEGSDESPTRAGPRNNGRFVYQFEAPSDPSLARFGALFADPRFGGVVKAMGVFALPRDVVVSTGDTGHCASPNAFYMPKKHVIFLCYPLAKAAYDNFVAMGKSDRDASNLTRDAMTFVLLHEMGHALVGELELGVTGKEEDAVDELAALILIQNGKHDMAIAGTYALVLLKEFQGRGKPTPFFDEHSVSEARLYDMFCMILGSDPKKFSEEILRERPELRRRAPKCPDTYKKIDKAWTDLLAPHRR